MKSNILPIVSVIIPVLNGIKYIKKCLEHITKQDYPDDKLEIIIVDNGSTDGTIGIIKEFNVKLVHCLIKGASAARNLGVEQSTGEILIFIDADCLADTSLVRCHVDTHMEFRHENPAVKVIGGSIAGVITNYWSLCDDFCCWFQQHPKLKSRYITDYWPTANVSISRTAFYKIGKFNIHLQQAEDVEFCKRVFEHKYQMYFAPLAKVHHMNRTCYRDVLKRIKYWAKINDDHIKYGIVLRRKSIILFAIMNFSFTSLKPIYYSFLVKRFHVLLFLPFLIQNAFLFSYHYMLGQYAMKKKYKL